MLGLCPLGSGSFIGPNKSINYVLPPILSGEQTAVMLISIMKKGLYLTDTYSPMTHYLYSLSKGIYEPLHSKNKEHSPSPKPPLFFFFFASHSVSNTRAPFTASGMIKRKNSTGFSRIRIWCVLRSFNKQKRDCLTGGRNSLLKVCHLSPCWMKLAALRVWEVCCHLTSAEESLHLHLIDILLCMRGFFLHKYYIEKEESLAQVWNPFHWHALYRQQSCICLLVEVWIVPSFLSL